MDEMRWVAGVHLNTDNPHVHLLLNKHAISRETQSLIRIPKLTAPLIAHYTIRPDKTRVFSYGTIINSEDLRSILISPPRGLIIATEEKSLRLEKVLEHDFTHHLQHTIEPSRARPDRLTIAHDSSAKEHSHTSPLIRSR